MNKNILLFYTIIYFIMKQHTYKKKTHKKKFNTDLCDDKLTFQECELAILRHAVDETEEKQKKKNVYYRCIILC